MDPQILYDIFAKTNRLINEGRDIIKLNVGEPEQQPLKLLFTAINTALNSGRTTYASSAGEPKLRNLLAKYHNVREENVLIGPGSKFLIYSVLKLISQEKKTGVIIPLPAWSAFALMLTNLGLINKASYIKTLEKDSWQLPENSLAKVITKNTHSIIITSPNNPTSTKVTEREYQEILKLAQNKGVTVIKDCAYQALSFQEERNVIDLTHTIEIHSFSKKFCMTGFRIGYILAPKSIIDKLTKFMQITISNVPLFIQDGVIKLLEEKPKFPRSVAKIYQQRAERIGKMLSKEGITFVKPDAGFYIFANLKTDTEKLAVKLIERGVAIVPGAAFGPYPTYARISLTEEDTRLKKGIQIITNSL